MHCLINMDKSELAHSLLIWVINYKPRKIFSIFSQTFLPFHTLQLVKFLPFHIPERATVTMERYPWGRQNTLRIPCAVARTGLKMPLTPVSYSHTSLCFDHVCTAPVIVLKQIVLHSIIYTPILKSDSVCSVKGVVIDPDTTLPSKHLGPLRRVGLMEHAPTVCRELEVKRV